MGHFHTTVRATGCDRDAAESAAIADFFDEHGQRHSLRGVELATLVRKVPPPRRVESQEYGHTYIRFEDDAAAPPEQWLEEWEFILHTHA